MVSGGGFGEGMTIQLIRGSTQRKETMVKDPELGWLYEEDLEDIKRFKKLMGI